MVEDADRFPSPILLDVFREVRGPPGAELRELLAAAGRPASFAPGAPERALDPAEWRLWRFTADEAVANPGEVLARRAPHIARGDAAAAARAGDAFTGWDGRVPKAGADLDPTAPGGVVLSSNGLETAGACPRRFFYHYALGIEPPEELVVDPRAGWTPPPPARCCTSCSRSSCARSCGSGATRTSSARATRSSRCSSAGTSCTAPATPSPRGRSTSANATGAFVAYQSNESGRGEVYVRPFPGPGPKRQVSTNGGFIPSWSRDGREIFYWQPDQVGRLMKVAFDPGDPKLARPQALFDVPLAQVDFLSLMPGNQQFVMVEPETEEASPLLIVVIPGFLDEMKARLAGKRP